MDHDHGVSLAGAPAIFERGVCLSCALAREAACQDPDNGPAYVAEAVMQDAVVISGSAFKGLAVVPSECTRGLEELPVARRAHVLAALRLAVRMVRDAPHESASRVVVVTQSPASADHVWFLVSPTAHANL